MTEYKVSIYQKFSYFHVNVSVDKVEVKKRFNFDEALALVDKINTLESDEYMLLTPTTNLPYPILRNIKIHLGNVLDNFITDGVIRLLSHEELLKVFDEEEEASQ